MALHAGRPASVRLSRLPQAAPIELSAEGVTVTREQLFIERSDRGVMVRLGEAADAPRVDLVEHLFAALGGLGITRGLHIEIVGGEVPLLDGGAADFCRALASLDLGRACSVQSWPSLAVVQRPFSWSVDEVRYSIEPADVPSLEVTIAFPHPAIGRQTCRFAFDDDDFTQRIAPARTFGFARDWPTLLAQGRARGVDLRSVCVFDDDDDEHASSSPTVVTDEPVRHKLLDLLGDCTLLGGPFRGALRATRPGHAATHAFLAAARAAGAVGAPG